MPVGRWLPELEEPVGTWLDVLLVVRGMARPHASEEMVRRAPLAAHLGDTRLMYHMMYDVLGVHTGTRAYRRWPVWSSRPAARRPATLTGAARGHRCQTWLTRACAQALAGHTRHMAEIVLEDACQISVA